MSRFIELIRTGSESRVYVNTTNIAFVEDYKECTAIFMCAAAYDGKSDNLEVIYVKESYKAVISKINE